MPLSCCVILSATWIDFLHCIWAQPGLLGLPWCPCWICPSCSCSFSSSSHLLSTRPSHRVSKVEIPWAWSFMPRVTTLGWFVHLDMTQQRKHCLIRWMQNFKETVTIQQWEKLWNKSIKFTANYNLRENWYKMLTLMVQRVNNQKINKPYSHKYWKCLKTILPYLWTCKKPQKYWKEIYHIIQRMLEAKSEMNLVF